MNLGTLHCICKLTHQKVKNMFYFYICPVFYIISTQINLNFYESAQFLFLYLYQILPAN